MIFSDLHIGHNRLTAKGPLRKDKRKGCGSEWSVSQLVCEGVGLHWLLFSYPSLADRVVPRNGLIFRLEPVGYDNGSEELLYGYSSDSSFIAKQRECLFPKGHHDLIRYFCSRHGVLDNPRLYSQGIRRTPVVHLARGKAYKNTGFATKNFPLAPNL